MTHMTEHDIYLFREGTHTRLYEKLGCQLEPGSDRARFGVWAPNAAAVSVVGDFNGWNTESLRLAPRGDESGIWQGDAGGMQPGAIYKYCIDNRHTGERLYKSDPYAFHAETPPLTASRVWPLDYRWNDTGWVSQRAQRNGLSSPISIYEVHLGAWKRTHDGRWLTYREMAEPLAKYAVVHGFTHVEIMPVTEHPFYGSWGYQTTGYFAPTSRYGTPQDFMFLVDTLHAHGIGVVLDWVPSHFPDDPHGLARFDGTRLYEHDDPRQGYHPEWKSLIFNYGRHEVRSFLLSSALYWIDRYHIDALRVDGVASMLYLDYGRRNGEWIPNEHGGRENTGAVRFLQTLNTAVYREHPHAQVIAEESTAWPMVSRPVDAGGLGFGMKWNMGWMHDTLDYMAKDPVHRRHEHGRLTFSIWYAFTENFVLPLSHDEVVYGKRSLIDRMPGDRWQQFANLRLLYGYMWAHPGKKLLFMGGEFGQHNEFQHDGELQWDLLRVPEHAAIARWMTDLNRLYASEPALHAGDFTADGFRWLEANDAPNSVIAFQRQASANSPSIVVVLNFTPVPRENYVIGLPTRGRWLEVLNSDALTYGGSGMGNGGSVLTHPVPAHGHYQSATLTLPPLAAIYLRHED